MRYAIAVIIGCVISFALIAVKIDSRIDALQDQVATVELHQDAFTSYISTHAFDRAGFMYEVKTHGK